MSDQDNPFGSKPSDDPFGSRPSGDAPDETWRSAAPPHDPSTDPTPPAKVNADGAIASLVLGIVGLVFCPLCAPFAWVLGRKAERQVDASGGALSGRGEATAGKILGIIACVLMILALIALIVLIAVGSGIDTSSSTSIQVD